MLFPVERTWKNWFFIFERATFVAQFGYLFWRFCTSVKKSWKPENTPFFDVFWPFLTKSKIILKDSQRVDFRGDPILAKMAIFGPPKNHFFGRGHFWGHFWHFCTCGHFWLICLNIPVLENDPPGHFPFFENARFCDFGGGESSPRLTHFSLFSRFFTFLTTWQSVSFS